MTESVENGTDGGTGADDAESGGDGRESDRRAADGATTATAGGVHARYFESETERVLAFEGEDGRTAALAQNREGYAMVAVRQSSDAPELERYYGFDVALDHAAELLGVSVGDLPVPEAAADMGM